MQLTLQPPAPLGLYRHTKHSPEAPLCFQPSLICSWGAPWGHRDANRILCHCWSLSPLGSMGFLLALGHPGLALVLGAQTGLLPPAGQGGSRAAALLYLGLSTMARSCSLARWELGRLRCCWSCTAATQEDLPAVL